jgi:hypothetical protein
MRYWRRMEKIKWSETNEKVLERKGEKRTLLNNILHREVKWIVHILKINYLLHDAIEGQMTIGRTQQLDDLRNRRYRKLQEEAEDRIRKKPQSINRAQGRNTYLPEVHGAANK